MITGLDDLLGNKFDKVKFLEMQTDMKENKFLAYVYSKVQGVELAQIINSIKDKTTKDQLCEDFYLYANSQSSISAPYYKLE